MKILHVGPVEPHPSSSGVNQSIRGSVLAEAKIGLEIGLLPSSPQSCVKTFGEFPGVCLIEGPHRRHYNPWFISKNWVNCIREEFGRPDLVIFHSTYIPFHIALARRCRELGWPYIVIPHGGMNVGAQNVKKTKKFIGNILFFRAFVKHAGAIYAKSEMEASEIRSFFPDKHIFTISNAVDDSVFDMSKCLPAAKLGDFALGTDLMMGYVGRINVYHKGIDLLLEAMAIFKSLPEGPRCKLFMVGPFVTKKDENYVLSTIRSLGLENVVSLIGPKFGQEKWSYFLACDIFVHTSRFEAGVPIALIEAMALGRPCMATPGASVTTVKEGGGWMCDANPDSIANTILEIYKSKESLPAIGRRLQDFAREHFTWRKVAEQEREEYAKLCNLTAENTKRK
ncbi:MAG: glycosyltransferase family 4 protein [Sedimentisphaerales bacterium]|nr:glycosyltransferase family 4 protein [Sedimentisphaerales bacterium]